MIPQEISKLLIAGDRALNTGEYVEAIIIFEQLYQDIEPTSSHFFHIQRKLVKAYYESDAKQKAILLCQEIIATDCLSNKMWGEIFLYKITEKPIIHPIEKNLPLDKSYKQKKIIKEKSLSEFRTFCKSNLLPQLKKIEKH